MPKGNPGIKRKPLSEEHKESIRRKLKGIIPWSTGLKMSDESKEKNRQKHIGKNLGEKHWNWKGGISTENEKERHSSKQKQWRSDVFARDNWTCQTCGLRGIKLEAHHIKGWARFPELRFDIDNGVSLCEECHKLTDNYKGKSNRKNNDFNASTEDNSEGQTQI